MTQATETVEPTEPSTEQLAALERTRAAMAQLDEALAHAEAAFKASLAGTQAPYDFAIAKLAEVEGMERALPAGHPDHAYAANALRIQRRLFEANRDMLAATRAIDASNLEIATSAIAMFAACDGNPNAWLHLLQEGHFDPEFKFPRSEDDLGYQGARARLQLFLGLHLWLACVDGIDAILRAAGVGEATEPATPAEAEARAKIAAVVKGVMDRDPEAAKALSSLAAELDESFTYLQWASQQLRPWDELPEATRRQRLADPDWLRLSGRVSVLSGLIERVQAYPEVAALFPEARPAGLPFDQPDGAGA